MHSEERMNIHLHVGNPYFLSNENTSDIKTMKLTATLNRGLFLERIGAFNRLSVAFKACAFDSDKR